MQDIFGETIQINNLKDLDTTSSFGNAANQYENGRKNLASDVLCGLRLTGSIANFKEVNSISSFTILVNGETIDSQFSDYQRVKYYDLCCSQNSFLHDNLRKNINSKLAAEIISETINIVDAIRACELLTPLADFEDWDNTLKGFELLGMNVQFLRARVARLMSIAMEAVAVKDPQRKSKVRLEQAHAEKEMDFLKLKLSKLKKTKERLDDEIEALKVNVVRHEIVFQEVVNAPWWEGAFEVICVYMVFLWNLLAYVTGRDLRIQAMRSISNVSTAM